MSTNGNKGDHVSGTLVLTIVATLALAIWAGLSRYSLVMTTDILNHDAIMRIDNWTGARNQIGIIGPFNRWDGLTLTEVIRLKLGGWVDYPPYGNLFRKGWEKEEE